VRDRHDPDRSARFVRTLLPWLLGLGMLIGYVATLNAWVSLDSLRLVWSVSGLNWQRQLFSPVTFLVTYPFGWLPAAWVPLALNLFNATCAALSLALLARSVALLPHDRTHAERLRLNSHRRYLTIRSAWLPPTLAVLLCGWQLSFWENAVAATGEMFDLLLFAYLVRCLLEFRLKHEQKWLLRFGLVYGLAVANNWAMAAFGPAFVIAIIWMDLQPVTFLALDKELKGLRSAGVRGGERLLRIIPSIIDVRPLARALGWWLAGFSLFLLLPALASLATAPHADFWPSLRLALRTFENRLLYFPRYHVLMACLTSVLPVLFMGICWRRSREDEDRASKNLGDNVLYVVHGFFLAVCLWTMLDSPFSPRGLKFGYPGLPLYFLSSLSIGYFSGCFLLVFGRSRSRPLVRRLITASIWLLAIAGPGVLLCKNLPGILLNRTSALAGYAAQVRQSLPSKGAVILSEDPFRLLCLESALAGAGESAKHLLIDTILLKSQTLPYLQFLERRHPDFKLAGSLTNQLADMADQSALMDRLRDFAQEGRLYYLHPPFGSLLEVFHASPHGLIYQLRPYSTNEAEAASLSEAELANNQAFWRDVETERLSGLVRRTESVAVVRPAIVQGILKLADVAQEPDREAAAVGPLYSAGLDYWGVELQKRELLAEAERCFDLARRLNPANPAARINLKANKDLQAHAPAVIRPLRDIESHFGRASTCDQVLRNFGPVDEANHCFYFGRFFFASSYYRQAIEQFERVKALAPHYPGVRVLLAQALCSQGDFTRGLAEARVILRTEPQDPDALLVEGLALFETAHFREAIPPLTEVLALQSSNYVARLYRARARWNLNDLEAARQDYEGVVQAAPGAYLAYYGLADIAYRKKDIPAAVRNCELYLGCAPPDLAETRVVEERLKELKHD
jgi:tetratricopeptide (TPR) repeat protein